MSDIRRVDRTSKTGNSQSTFNYIESYSDPKKKSNNLKHEIKTSRKGSKNYSLNNLSDQDSDNELTNKSKIARAKKSDSIPKNNIKNKKYDNKLIIETNSNIRRVKNRSVTRSRSNSRDRNEERSSRSSKSRAGSNCNKSKILKTNNRSKSKSPVNGSRSRSTSSNKNYYASKESKLKSRKLSMNINF